MNNAPSNFTLSDVKRFAISVRNYLEMLPPDTPAWLWDGESDSLGLECWREITGFDSLRNGNVSLWVGSGEIEVVPSTMVYVGINGAILRAAQCILRQPAGSN
jgi:hypothetical protein